MPPGRTGPERSFPEPQIAPEETGRLVVLALRQFGHGAGDVGLAAHGLPALEVEALQDRRVEALSLAQEIEAGRHSGWVLVKVRGYYLDSEGRRSWNDVGVFDDATILARFLHGVVVDVVRVRGNVDPNAHGTYRDGRGVASVVAPQLYHVAEGRHRSRRGLRQASPVLVDRYGADHLPGKGWEFRQAPADWPFLNEHDDRGRGTGSAGCGTYPPGEWAALYAAARDLGRIPVVVVEESARRAWKAAGLL